MRAHFHAAVLAASLLFGLSLFVPDSARAQSPGSARAQAPDFAEARTGDFAVDLLLGLTSGSDQLGASTGVPDGVFNLRDLDAAPILGLGILFPETVLGSVPERS